MNQVAKKITSFYYIWLVLSAPGFNAARVKQHFNAARANKVSAREDSRQSQKLLQEMEEAMQEINQIKSEHLFADMGQASYWGESWASCSDRLEDFKRREKKMEARYDNAMKDGEMSGMEAGRVALKAYSVASTLSAASKSGCEWVTNTSIESSSMNKIMAETMEEQKCFDAAKEYLEKARAANDNPDEAIVNANKIMLSMDCKLPSASIEEQQKSSHELAVMEETAEAGALSEIQEFKKRLDAGKQTSLVETNLSQQVVPVLTVLIYFLITWFQYALVCTVVYTVIATLLTMVFLALKAAFKFVLGLSSTADFQTEMGQIMKPFFTIIATGCSAYFSMLTGVFLALAGGGELALWLGVAGSVALVHDS